MLASDLKLLNLVFREHLHYNRYITMTTYANCTISKARVNNLYMKNAFELWLSWNHTTEALDSDWVPGRIFNISWTGWPHGREQWEAGHRDPVSHRWQKTKTGPVFTWSVGVISSLRNLKRKVSVYLQIMSMLFWKGRKSAMQIHIHFQLQNMP